MAEELSSKRRLYKKHRSRKSKSIKHLVAAAQEQIPGKYRTKEGKQGEGINRKNNPEKQHTSKLYA